MHGQANIRGMGVLHAARDGIWLGWTAQDAMDYKAAPPPKKKLLNYLNIFNKKSTQDPVEYRRNQTNKLRPITKLRNPKIYKVTANYFNTYPYHWFPHRIFSTVGLCREVNTSRSVMRWQVIRRTKEANASRSMWASLTVITMIPR